MNSIDTKLVLKNSSFLLSTPSGRELTIILDNDDSNLKAEIEKLRL